METMSVSPLAAFKAQCEEIKDRYEKVCSMDLLPLETLTGQVINRDQIAEWQKNLEEQSFTIAVCGQIKAGKSTLLNALMFEEDLIPEADTPLTAAITLIKYTDKQPYFEVTYYTREKWNAIQKSLEEKKAMCGGGKSGDAQKPLELQSLEKEIRDLEAEWKAMRERGVEENRLLGTTETVHELSRARLEEFVAPVAAGSGRVTPLVEHVTLYINNENLRHVTIVDTPGTNDTNVARSQVTLNWINKADAVLFLTYAGRAFDKKDLEFIDQYLLGVPGECLFIVINKTDTLEGAEKVSDLRHYFVKEILENENICTRKDFVTEKTAYAFISALAERLHQKEKKGEELDENDEYYLEKIEEKGKGYAALLHENFSNFRKLLEEKLIQSSGKHTISSHIQHILGIFEGAVRKAESDCHQQQQILNDLEMAPKDLENKKQDLNKTLEDMGRWNLESKRELSEHTRRALDSIQRAANREKEILGGKLNGIVSSASSDDFKGPMAWSIKSAIKQALNACVHEIQDALLDLQDEYSNIVVEFEDKLKASDPSFIGIQGIRITCNAKVREYFANFSNMANALDKDTFASIYEERKRTFLFWEYGKDETLAECRDVARSMIEDVLENVEDSVSGILSDINERQDVIQTSIVNAFRDAVQKRVDGVEKLIKKVAEDIKEKESERDKAGQELESLKKRLDDLKSSQNELVAWQKTLAA